jgi:hypothetical protein
MTISRTWKLKMQMIIKFYKVSLIQIMNSSLKLNFFIEDKNSDLKYRQLALIDLSA